MNTLKTDQTPAPHADQPAYRASEASSILGIPKTTIQAWCFGQGYMRLDGKKKSFVPLVRPASLSARALSFKNLCELHVLGVIRRHHRIHMPVVRKSLEYVENQLRTQSPLVAEQFLTNGVDLFIEKASELINVSRDGQTALRGEFMDALARIQRNNDGSVVRLFPYSRVGTTTSAQPKAVMVDPTVAFGRPVLVGAGVTTDVIKDRFLAGDSFAEMADDYRVTEADIAEALRFGQRIAA